jgi:hypothetical protein
MNTVLKFSSKYKPEGLTPAPAPCPIHAKHKMAQQHKHYASKCDVKFNACSSHHKCSSPCPNVKERLQVSIGCLSSTTENYHAYY